MLTTTEEQAQAAATLVAEIDPNEINLHFSNMSDADYLSGDWGGVAEVPTTPDVVDPTVVDPVDPVVEAVDPVIVDPVDPAIAVDPEPVVVDPVDPVVVDPAVVDPIVDPAVVETPATFEPMVVTIEGVDISLNTREEVQAFLIKGAAATTAASNQADHRGTIDALTSAGVLEDPATLNLLLEAHKGNPQAISQLAIMHKTDLLSEAAVQDYVPDNHVKPADVLDLESVIATLETAGTFEALNAQTSKWDSKSHSQIFENPVLLSSLADDMSDGTFDAVNAHILKSKIVGGYDNNASYLENYHATYIDLYAAEANAVPPAAVPPVVTPVVPVATPPVNKVARVPGSGGSAVTHTAMPSEAKVQAAIKEMASMSDAKWLATYGKK